MTSDIAHFRECQVLQEQSAHHGLYGYAIVARHDFIEGSGGAYANLHLRVRSEMLLREAPGFIHGESSPLLL